jgi:hypothetical protein
MRTGEVALSVMMLMLSVTGCDGGRTERGAAPAPMTEHRAVEAGAGSRQLGEDCTRGSHSDCASGLCLHASTQGASLPGGGYFCSRTCQAPAECPSKWRCQQVLPGAAEQLCVPPSGWTASAAGARGTPGTP